MYTVIGIEHVRGTTKEGKPFAFDRLYLVGDFDSRIKSCDGKMTTQESCDPSISKDLKPGQKIRINYGKGRDGKAYLSGVEVMA